MNAHLHTDPATLFKGLRSGDRVALGRAITLVESLREADKEAASQLIDLCLPHAGASVRIAVSGAPGVGKSTFIEAYGSRLTDEGHQVAVLAIDPSSGLHRGSILGDKTRMESLARDPRAFIRPSPAGTTLGGVARTTRESILICEAAGYDRILVETVGVGQSETAAQAMVDLFLLLLLPGAGDSLQGIKRGIVEMADLLIVNKADAARQTLAEETRMDYARAVHLYPPRASGQTVEVLKASATTGEGIPEIAQTIATWIRAVQDNSYLLTRRREQAVYWLRESFSDQLLHWAHRHLAGEYTALEEEVRQGRISPFAAADKLLHRLFQAPGDTDPSPTQNPK